MLELNQSKISVISFIKRFWLLLLLSIVGLGILVIGFILFRPDTYLPHDRIVLHVPYDINSPPMSLIPMGEKVYHPNSPSGHPGIDIQWDSPDANVLVAADGKIISIRQEFDKWDKWEIIVETWPYVVRYKEMETYNQDLKVGQQVKTGDFLGHPANPKPHNEIGAYQIHWEFGSPSVGRDRFCPTSYFDQESRDSLQAVWVKTNWQYKSEYPDICSGDYANKTE